MNLLWFLPIIILYTTFGVAAFKKRDENEDFFMTYIWFNIIMFVVFSTAMGFYKLLK